MFFFQQTVFLISFYSFGWWLWQPLAILNKDFLFKACWQRLLKVSGNGHYLSGTGRFKSLFFSEPLTGKGFIALACRLNLQASQILLHLLWIEN